jgi:type I restriction enzyme R subunit
MGNNEPGYVSQARREAYEADAVNNFKKDFEFEKPETGIGMLCVCDRLLTGFDAPVEQVMYLDKGMREHDLFQAIARVNRTKKGKSYGLIVDYFGITKHLSEALNIYTDRDKTDLLEFQEVFRDINKEIPVLEARYKRLIDLFKDNKLEKIEDFLRQTFKEEALEFEFAEDCIEVAKNMKFRAELLTYAKSFFDSLDLLFNVHAGIDYQIPAKRLGYLIWRIKDRYKDETMDLKWASEKVRKLIDKHLQSLGIDTKITKVSILSDDFKTRVDYLNKTPKSKASEMEHAIRWHIKANLDKDPALYNRFKDRLEMILNAYKENWEEILKELTALKEEMKVERKKEEPFFDLISSFTGSDTEADQDRMQLLTEKVLSIIKESAQIKNFWTKSSEIRKMEGIVEEELIFSGFGSIREKAGELTAELMKLAKNREAYLR